MANMEKMREDTARLINEWGQNLTIKRRPHADGSHGQEAGGWEIVQQGGQDTIKGDAQPTGGSVVLQKQGREITINYRILLPYDADVEPNDRIYFDDTYCRVEVADKHPDHVEVLGRIE